MKSFNRGSIVVMAIIIIVLAIVGGGTWYVISKSNKGCTQESKICPDGTTVGRTGPNCEFAECLSSPTETPAAESDVTNQPAYLIAAYSKNGKNYIDVDYVEWLHGETSIKAQVEDGKCTSASECYDYPNGYKRNQNPKIRTFEVSSLASIKVNGGIAAKINEADQTHLGNPYGRNLEISFKKLADIVSKMKSYLPYDSPFKEPKAFITIDVKDNIVTRIIEPFQD